MPLYYINGISGAGKSTILSELRNRGYASYDVDEPGPVTARWHNIKTGYIHPKSSIKAADRTATFLAEHVWSVLPNEVEALKISTDSKPVFFGGAVANEHEFTGLCDRVFSLVVDDQTMLQRLARRTTNDWGKSPLERTLSLESNRALADTYKALKYTIIDASKPVNDIVSEILSFIHEK